MSINHAKSIALFGALKIALRWLHKSSLQQPQYVSTCKPAFLLPTSFNKMEPTNPNANTFEKLICPNDTLVGHSCRKLLWDTLVGHSCGTLCGTLLWDTLVGHSCGILLWDSLVGHSCGTLLWDTLVGHSCGTLF